MQTQIMVMLKSTTDGGASWENITTFTGDNNYVAEGLTSIDISTLAGNPAVQIRFRYVGAWGYYWGVDNIEVTQNVLQLLLFRLVCQLYLWMVLLML